MAFLKTTQGKVSVIKSHITCTCESDEHQLNFSFFIEDDDPYLYCTFHLSPEKNILKRLLTAFKYALGYRSKFGSFDEVVLDHSKVSEIKEVIDSFQKVYPEK